MPRTLPSFRALRKSRSRASELTPQKNFGFTAKPQRSQRDAKNILNKNQGFLVGSSPSIPDFTAMFYPFAFLCDLRGFAVKKFLRF
jgi:hypothetical protein